MTQTPPRAKSLATPALARGASVFSTSQALFALAILLFFFTILNGYILNLVAGHRANAWVVGAGVAAEFAALYFFARRRVSVEFDPLELAGFLVVTLGVWFYFIAASLPTLLPPTQSEDAARIYLQIAVTFPEGQLVSWYPAGGTFFVATFAHWLGWEPLRVLHLVASLFAALCASAVYGITCALISSPVKRGRAGWGSPIIALIAPALLFVPWSYFAGMLDWEQYFFAQTFAQLFILAALWFTQSYTSQPSAIFAALVGVALICTVAAYPVFVGLPFGLFALVVLAQSVRGARYAWIAPVVFTALLAAFALVLDRTGILEFRAGQISLSGDVGTGGVATASLDSFGGPIFLLLALVGSFFAWRAGSRGKTLLALLVVWGAQYIALIALQPVLKISGYRVDKTFYILVFPFAIFATLALARLLTRFEPPRRWLPATWVGTVVALIAAVALWRPPISFSPFTESELQTAQWAKKNLDTLQVNYLDPMSIRSYWLAWGIWGETLPNEWWQWIPAGAKLGPGSFQEWLGDPGWGSWLLVRDVNTLGSAPVQVVYQNGASVIVQKNSTPLSLGAPSRLARWYYESTLNLIGYDLPRDKFLPGETIRLTTYTESTYPPRYNTVRWRMMLLDRNGAIVSQMERDPFDNKYPVQRWSPGKIARDEWSLPIDGRAPPGVYVLNLGLFRRETGTWVSAAPVLTDGVGKSLSAASFAKIKIPFPAPSDAELRAAKPLGARLGDNLALASYTLNVDRAARRAHLTLYWQDLAKTPNDYTAFVHLLDASGKVIAQSDREPLNGNYPTSAWDAGEIVKDEYDLEIPATASAPLAIEIGMYAQPSLKRLPVDDTDRILLNIQF